jgi:transcriptional regulator with XRE-family HTH domain
MAAPLNIEAISQAVDDARAARGWSGAEFARRVGVDGSTLWKVLHGKSHVKEDTYNRIDDVLGWPKGTTINIGHGGEVPERSVQQRIEHLEHTVEEIYAMLKRRFDDPQTRK